MVGKARRRRGGRVAGRAEASAAVARPVLWRLPGAQAPGRAAADGGLRESPGPVRPEGWARSLCPAPFTSGCGEEQAPREGRGEPRAACWRREAAESCELLPPGPRASRLARPWGLCAERVAGGGEQ